MELKDRKLVLDWSVLVAPNSVFNWDGSPDLQTSRQGSLSPRLIEGSKPAGVLEWGKLRLAAFDGLGGGQCAGDISPLASSATRNLEARDFSRDTFTLLVLYDGATVACLVIWYPYSSIRPGWPDLFYHMPGCHID
jgi:hypothetical protein